MICISKGRYMMNNEEINIYREVQKNADMAVKAIDTLESKVYDKEFALQISRQALKYTDFKNKAVESLLAAKVAPEKSSVYADTMLKMGIHMNTMFNTSTSHLSELMIKGSNMGITEMYKVLNHNPQEKSEAGKLAGELMDFEEKNISILRKYL